MIHRSPEQSVTPAVQLVSDLFGFVSSLNLVTFNLFANIINAELCLIFSLISRKEYGYKQAMTGGLRIFSYLLQFHSVTPARKRAAP